MRRAMMWVLVLFVAAGAAWDALRAQDPAKTEELLPSRDVATPEEIQKNFRPQKFSPLADTKLYFEILVPNGWEAHLSDVDPGQVAQDKDTPVQVADFEPGGGVDDVGVQVSYVRVPENVSLSQFMDTYIKKSGGTVLVRREAEFKSHRVQDVLLKTNDDSLGPMLTRTTAMRHGEIVFITTGGAAEEKYEKNKRTFAAVAVSLEPLGK